MSGQIQQRARNVTEGNSRGTRVVGRHCGDEAWSARDRGSAVRDKANPSHWIPKPDPIIRVEKIKARLVGFTLSASAVGVKLGAVRLSRISGSCCS